MSNARMYYGSNYRRITVEASLMLIRNYFHSYPESNRSVSLDAGYYSVSLNICALFYPVGVLAESSRLILGPAPRRAGLERSEVECGVVIKAVVRQKIMEKIVVCLQKHKPSMQRV